MKTPYITIFGFNHPTRTLLAPYSHPTRTLLAPYSHPTRTLLAQSARSVCLPVLLLRVLLHGGTQYALP